MKFEKEKKDTFVLYTENAIRHKWRNKHLSEKDLKIGEKIYHGTDSGTVIIYDITECLKGLFDTYRIDYTSNLKDQVISKDFDSAFYRDLFYYISLLSNTRDSISGVEGDDADKIVCASCGFDSGDGFQGKKFNGDANGAYNIARKGVLILKKINQYYDEHNQSCEKLGNAGLFIDMDEWDTFVSY
ncbi:hypothetical protein KKG82_00470 [Patescibacteria group bacterium]|nr:hypothetical protein [Patescibacteria group bacterium]